MRKFLLLLAFHTVLCSYIKAAAVSSDTTNYTTLKERVCKQISSTESLSELVGVGWNFLRGEPGMALVCILDAETPQSVNQLSPMLKSEKPKVHKCGSIFMEDPTEIAKALVELSDDWAERPLRARWEKARFSSGQRTFIEEVAKAFLLKIHELSSKSV